LSAHRLELLKRLSELIGEVEPLIWASLWLSDLEAEEAPDTTRFSFDGIAAKHDFIRKWTQNTRRSKSNISSVVPSSPPSVTNVFNVKMLKRHLASLPDSPQQKKRGKTENRSQTVVELCRERDNCTCVLTRARDPVEAAHIFPFSMRSESLFSDPTSVWRTWYDAVFSRGT